MDDETGDGNPASPVMTPRARLLLRLTPLPAVPLAVALFFLGAPLADVLLVPLIVAVLPVLAIVQALALRRVEIETLPVYASSAVSILLLAAVCTAAGVWGRGWAAVGLTGMAWGPLAAWSLGLTLAGLGILVAFRLVAGRFGIAEHPFLRQLLPRTRREKLAFVGVSLSAGVGEELVFRGYAIGALSPFLGVFGALALSTASFGVVHAYQGLVGFFRTAVLGGVLAWGYLATGSIVPAMVAHALLDVLAGIVLAERLMIPEADSGV